MTEALIEEHPMNSLPQQSIHRLFEAQVARSPNTPCLRYEGTTWTYAEVNQKANRIAHQLVSAGLKPGNFVGVLVTRTPHMVTSLIAILKTGCAYVPLDPEAPKKRIAFIIEDLQTPWVIYPSSLQAMASELDLQAINYQEFMDEQTLGDQNLGFDGFAKTPAYVMYTSGTTGNPKGALIEHRGVIRLGHEPNYFHYCPKAVFLQTSTAAFDAATYEIWPALLHGFSLVCMKKGILLDPAKFAEVLVAEKVTHLHLTTGLFNVLVQSRPEIFSHVESLLTGGEAMNIELARKLFESYPPKNFCNVYGPTENTTYSTFERLNEENLAGTRAPIGKAISYSTTFIVDREGKLIKDDQPGELWVGGPGLAQCYWRRPALTAEKFVPNGFSKEPGARAYRTGDKVALLPSGSIDFLGRIDFQVKLRGFRIELGEIETAIRKLDGVRDALVLLREDRPGDKRLAAYWLADKGLSTLPSQEQLATNLATQLPEYMLPSDWIHLEAFPLNANDKYDRKALPIPEQQDHASSEQQLKEKPGPRNPIEIKLGELWQAVLGKEHIGIEDDFFACGGNPSQVIQLNHHIQTVFNVSLNGEALSNAPTIATLSQTIFEDLRRQVREPSAASQVPTDQKAEKQAPAGSGSETTELIQPEKETAANADQPQQQTFQFQPAATQLKPRSLGKAAPGKQVLIMDADMTLLPPGALGELWIGGSGLARGYKNQPGLTAENFLPHPYSQEPGARIFRTGDLARQLATGEVILMAQAQVPTPEPTGTAPC